MDHSASAFGRYVDALSGNKASGATIGEIIGASDATADRRLNGQFAVKAEEVIAVARHYKVSPLGGLVACGFITSDEAERTALSSFTDVELCEEILTRAQSRALDAPVTDVTGEVTVQDDDQVGDRRARKSTRRTGPAERRAKFRNIESLPERARKDADSESAT